MSSFNEMRAARYDDYQARVSAALCRRPAGRAAGMAKRLHRLGEMIRSRQNGTIAGPRLTDHQYVTGWLFRNATTGAFPQDGLPCYGFPLGAGWGTAEAAERVISEW